MSMSDDRLEVHFTVEKPVEVLELTQALAGIARSYERVLKKKGYDSLEDEHYRLYLTEIKKNCVFAELAAYTATSLPLVYALDYHNSFADFASYLNSYIRYFQGKSAAVAEKIIDPTRSETKDFVEVLRLAASSERGCELRFEHVELKKGKRRSKTKFEYSSKEVNEALEGAEKKLASFDLEAQEIRKNVVLEIAVVDRKRSKGGIRSLEKGVIAEISKKELKVSWESELDGHRAKDPETTLKGMEFLVDVQVVRNSKNKLRLYRVLNLHGPIDE